MTRPRLLLLTVALAACSASGKPIAPTLAHPAETPATADEVRAVSLDGYTQLGQGYDSVYLDTVGRDLRVVFVGVRPGDVLVGFDGPRIIAQHRLFGDDALELVSKDLDAHLSHDASCAWVSDDLSYRSLRGPRRAFLPLRRTAVYERSEGRWLLVAEHISYPTPDAMAARVASPVPSIAASGEEAQAIRKRLVNVLAGTDESPVSLDEGSLAIGPRGERARGRDVARTPTPRSYFPGAGRVELTGLRIGISQSGTVAWATSSFAIGAGGPAARATFVLEKRGGLWWIVQTHVSRPITSETLAADLGMGAE